MKLMVELENRGLVERINDWTTSASTGRAKRAGRPPFRFLPDSHPASRPPPLAG
jgi:hypothetical protein